MAQHIRIAAPTEILIARVLQDTGLSVESGPPFSAPEPRHLLFCEDRVGLHLHLMLDTESWSTVVVGQILCLDESAGSVAGVPLEMVVDERVAAATESNELGEFQLVSTIDGPVSLRLHLESAVVEVTVDEMVHELEALPLSA